VSARENAIAFVRSLAVALLTSAIILGVLIVGFRGQTQYERQLQLETLYANLAQACVLALPVDPEVGRPADAVKQCFIQYNLQPPSLVHSEP
jgi:hypothetical protein